MKHHEYSNFFPLMEGEELAALITDIKEHGLLEPIVVLDGAILDGRNRFRACQEAGVTPTFTEYKGNGALTYVISKNVKRRHLSPSQLAVIALDILPVLEKEAAGRRLRTSPDDIKPKPEEMGSATLKAGTMLGVAPAQVQRAKHIQKEAPERLRDIKAGKATVFGVHKELRQKRAREAVKKQNGKTAAKKRQEEPREVGQFMDALKAWRKAVNEAIEVAKFGKFSPEAKAFVLKWLDDQDQKLAELREAFNA